MKVATCQLPEVRSDVRAALSLVREYAHEAAARGAGLVCFPECFLQGYDVDRAVVADAAIDLGAPEFARALNDLATLEPTIVVGLIERSRDRFYNAALAIRGGNVVAHYRKMHLLRGEQAVFAAGTGPAPFDAGGTRVGISICYDLNFTASFERNKLAGAELLVCPCSNMMRRADAEAWKPRHNEIRARHAKEHGLWIVSSDIVGERGDRSSYGPTAVIDPNGAIVAEVPLCTTGVVVVDVEPKKRAAR